MKGMNRDALRKVAATRGIPGRGKMTVEELREAVRKAVQSAPTPLTVAARVANYARQNSTVRLTPRQARRVRHNHFTATLSSGRLR